VTPFAIGSVARQTGLVNGDRAMAPKVVVSKPTGKPGAHPHKNLGGYLHPKKGC
jgi:hypothetical protein